MERDAQVADCHNTVGACGTPGGTFARHIHKPEFVSGRSWNMLLFNIYSQQELETAFGNIADSCGGGGGLATSYLPTEEELLSNDNFRAKRILGWLYTEKYEKSAGYQVIQSLYAIGSGSFFGKGLGNGTQKLSAIPEAQNDMIFAIICEELGVAGAIMLFLLYGYLLYQMYVIVKESSNVFGSMMVIGVMVHLVCQIVINVSVATNVIPNTGVTLPFISSGGSALLMTMVECGMCIGIRRQQTRRVYQKHLNE